MAEEVLALFIPIIALIALAVVIWAFLYYRYQTRSRIQETIRVALDKGNELTPELLERMADTGPAPNADLRRGSISIAIALATAGFGITIPDADATQVFMGLSAFPFAIGIAYLVMWRFGQRTDRR